MQPCHARVRDVAYFVRTRASSSEPLELNLVGKGGRAAGPLAAEERRLGCGRAVGFLVIDVHGWGPTAAGEDPSVWGRGRWEESLWCLREKGSVDREEAGTKRGMNVARLQCDAMCSAYAGFWVVGRADGETDR